MQRQRSTQLQRCDGVAVQLLPVLASRSSHVHGCDVSSLSVLREVVPFSIQPDANNGVLDLFQIGDEAQPVAAADNFIDILDPQDAGLDFLDI